MFKKVSNLVNRMQKASSCFWNSFPFKRERLTIHFRLVMQIKYSDSKVAELLSLRIIIPMNIKMSKSAVDVIIDVFILHKAGRRFAENSGLP